MFAVAIVWKDVIKAWYPFLIKVRIIMKAKLLSWVELFEYVTRKCIN